MNKREKISQTLLTTLYFFGLLGAIAMHASVLGAILVFFGFMLSIIIIWKIEGKINSSFFKNKTFRIVLIILVVLFIAICFSACFVGLLRFYKS
jgi:hypothetical protein